jgi:hypothetical protein
VETKIQGKSSSASPLFFHPHPWLPSPFKGEGKVEGGLFLKGGTMLVSYTGILAYKAIDFPTLQKACLELAEGGDKGGF